MYSKIINPETGRKVAINGKLGKTILRNYMSVLSGGSSRKRVYQWGYRTKSAVPPSELDSMHPIGEHRIINGQKKYNRDKGIILGYLGRKIVLKLDKNTNKIIIPHKYLTPISYNGKDIRLCCSNTSLGEPVKDKIPIPIIYVRAHGMTDSYVRTDTPLMNGMITSGGDSAQEAVTQEVLVVINSLPSPDERNGKLGRVKHADDDVGGGYVITSPADTEGYDGEKRYKGLDFSVTDKQIMPYYELTGGRLVRYLAYGTTVMDSGNNKGVIVSNLDSATGNFKVLFNPLNSSAPLSLHHSDLTPISSEMFTIPAKTYILTFTDVGDPCLLDFKQSILQETTEDLLIRTVLRPFMTKRKILPEAESDKLSDKEITELRKSLLSFSKYLRSSDLRWESERAGREIDTLMFKNNFRLLTPGSEMLDTWLDFKSPECTKNIGFDGRKDKVCDITCINTISKLTNYNTNRCTKYSNDMLTNKFHNNNLLSFRELIRNHGPGIYILSSCRSFVPGTDPRKGGMGADTPASVARQVSEGRSGPWGDKPATREGLRAGAAAVKETLREAAVEETLREAAVEERRP